MMIISDNISYTSLGLAFLKWLQSVELASQNKKSLGLAEKNASLAVSQSLAKTIRHPFKKCRTYCKHIVSRLLAIISLITTDKYFKWSSFPLSIESSWLLLSLCFTALGDWLEKLSPLSKPIRGKSNHDLFARFFPRLLPVSDWFIPLFASAAIGQSNITLQMVLI